MNTLKRHERYIESTRSGLTGGAAGGAERKPKEFDWEDNSVSFVEELRLNDCVFWLVTIRAGTRPLIKRECSKAAL